MFLLSTWSTSSVFVAVWKREENLSTLNSEQGISLNKITSADFTLFMFTDADWLGTNSLLSISKGSSWLN